MDNLAAQPDVQLAMEIELGKLVGRLVVVMGPKFLDSEKPQSVKLLAVETAGIWIDSKEATDKLTNLQRKPSSEGLAFFVPFAQITSIVAGVDTAPEQSATIKVSANGTPG
jgi:hypothetical protein